MDEMSSFAAALPAQTVLLGGCVNAVASVSTEVLMSTIGACDLSV